ncbi:MAG: S-layer y protein [Clostridia bacterium]|jgi:hypothetical protein|nr:S-layer y protein [Clostridia bacterium]
MKSKIISLGTAMGLVLSLAVNSFAAIVPFKDLDNVSAKEKIVLLQEKGYVGGIAEGVFAPHRTMTVAEGITLIVRLLELNLDTIRFIKEPKATDYFTKADNDAWYAEPFIIASVHGLGFKADLDPNQEWTREEFTYYLITSVEKFKNLPMLKIMPAKIADESQMTAEYSGAIQRALIYQVVKLDAKEKFNPKDKITRAEAAEQIYNMHEYINAHPAPTINE